MLPNNVLRNSFKLIIIALMAMVPFASLANNIEQKLPELKQLLQPLYQTPEQKSEGPAKATPILTPAVIHFYEQRDWKPIWDDSRFTSLLQQIRQLKNDGLDPDDYFLPELKTYIHIKNDEERSIKRELLATYVLLLALKHLQHGKVDPAQLSPYWNFEVPPYNEEKEITNARLAAENNTLSETFQQARPAVPAYAALQKALNTLSKQKNNHWPVIPEGHLLKPGMDDPRIPLLRKRLQMAGYKGITKNKQSTTYDKELVDAIQHFQKENHIEPDGKIGPDTLQQLNTSKEQRINQLRVNLERMRWHLHELPDRYIMVDVAGYHISYVNHGEKQWESRVQVGRAYRKTPIFQSVITHLTLNPQWKVPPTIFFEDALPAIRKNIDYLERHHLHVYNQEGEELPATSINWDSPDNITLVQEAGPEGALGQVVIRFPNDFSIYLHETPSKALFKKEQRAFSSGCIRVENIRELAVRLLDDSQHWSRGALETTLAEGKTHEVRLPHKIPILIAYWTVEADKEGHVQYRPDIYDLDTLVLQALDNVPPGSATMSDK